MRKNDMPLTIVEPNEGDYQFMPVDETWGYGHGHQGKINHVEQSLMICGKAYVRPRPTSLLANSLKLHHLLGGR
jgi:hypothetical protein